MKWSAKSNMKNTAKSEKRNSLVKRFKVNLWLLVSLLILSLILGLAEGFYSTITQYYLGGQKISIYNDLNKILQSMIDQESGLRGYIVTDNSTFLEPFTSGRPQYLSTLQDMKNQTHSSDFNATTAALVQVDGRASDWYNNFAEVQIKNLQSGNLSTARSESTSVAGKALFDRFRAAVSQLQQTVDRDLLHVQQQRNTIIWLATLGTLLLPVLVIVTLGLTFSRFSDNLYRQLDALKRTAQQLGAGDLRARAGELAHEELNQLGQSFNAMADALQEEREKGLKERNVLESVLQLNTLLTYSFDGAELRAIIDRFLSKALTLLDLHIGTLYLYDSERKQLTLFAAQGLDLDRVQTQFQPGEGTVGRVLVNREPLYLALPIDDEAKGFVVKSMFGIIRPSSTYYLPLIRGNELLGVLGVASIPPMTEKVRNVLNVVVSTLSSMVSNAGAYQHIQEQAEELAKRGHEQERTNAELRRQRDELTTLNAALEEANRARSQFLSTMSHELRTPLTSVIGFSQILLDDAAKGNYTQSQKNNLERILRNGKHLLVLINDVLDLAKIEAGRMDVNYVQVNPQELISAVVEETQSIAIGQKLTLKYSIEEGLGAFETDPMKLRQILLNLISNALKFTAQGEVTVTATRATSPNSEGEHIVIGVKDTGIGIAPEHQERIFEAFFQADNGNTRKFGGTGLGLSIVRQLTTLLGGTLQVSSSPGQGSTFTVILPTKATGRHVEQGHLHLNAVQGRAVPKLLPLRGETPPQVIDKLCEVSANREVIATQQQNVILVVDDNPDILILVRVALQNTPFEVVGVQDPLKVMETVQQLRPCAITLDVMMPNLNGWQLLNQLKTDPSTANIPVVMLTILSESTTGYVLGADEYLIKPFKTDLLLDIIQRLVSSKRLSQVSDLETQPV
jgi:signal transduction histidine kinase/CHASE3 domain sensor protein/ActR/RegA family two-component response regulator